MTVIKPVFYSVCPFGTGDLKTGSPDITIDGEGLATLTVGQPLQELGVGCRIEWDSGADGAWIAPNRIKFSSGGLVQIQVHDVIEGVTTGSTGRVRQIELIGGDWSAGTATGYIYFAWTTGDWDDLSEQINRILPTASSNVAGTAAVLQGNIGGLATQFVLKDAVGDDKGVMASAETVSSINHEFASLADWSSMVADINHMNSYDITTNNQIAHACCYHDHVDDTLDEVYVLVSLLGNSSASNYVYIFTPTGGSESKTSQRHTGAPSLTGSYRLDTSKTYNGSLKVDEDYVRIEGLQIRNDGSAGARCLDYPSSTGALVHLAYCVLIIESGDGNGFAAYPDKIGVSDWAIYNNVFISGNADRSAIFWTVDANNYAQTGGVYNNTIIGFSNASAGYAAVQLSGSASTNNINLKNNIVQDSYLDNILSNMQSTNKNISEDGTGGTNQITSTLTFASKVGHDYRLVAADADAIGAAEDLSPAITDISIWDDIVGTERVSWDIGAFEYIAPASGTAGPLVNRAAVSTLVNGGLVA